MNEKLNKMERQNIHLRHKEQERQRGDEEGNRKQRERERKNDWKKKIRKH